MDLRSIKEAVRPYYLRWLYFPLFPNRRPSYYAQSWEYPSSQPTPGNSATPDLLFLPMTDWHTRIQRTQHLANTFAAAGHRCFYLNPHLGREFPNSYAFSDPSAVRLLADRVHEIHVHLPLEPVFHDRLLTARESARIADVLSRLLEQAGTRKLVQIVSFPVWAAVAQQLRARFGFPITYDCHDVLAGFRNIAPEVVAAEEELLIDSDLVLFSAKNLLEQAAAGLPGIERKSILLRNAVDSSWIDASDRMRRKGSREDSERFTVGYVGALDFWFDVQAVSEAARAHPEWNFVLIGRIEDRRLSSLKRLANVQFVGEVPHHELHPHIANFDAAVIPFLRNELTMGTNPIKLYEYFSYGLPVIGSRLPEIEQFGDLVYVYDDAAGFLQQLQQSRVENQPELVARRIEVAHRETWTKRVETLEPVFAELLRTQRTAV